MMGVIGWALVFGVVGELVLIGAFVWASIEHEKAVQRMDEFVKDWPKRWADMLEADDDSLV